MKILMLYTRLAGYWMTCIQEYLSMYGGEFIIVKDKRNPNASFKFSESDNIRLYDHDDFTKRELLEFCIQEDPDIIYVVGWTQKDYLMIARYFFKKGIPVICGVDNPWKNTLRQRYGSIYSNLFLTNRFSHIWIPGKPQHEFAKRLGFSSNQILSGLYSADFDLFYKEYLKNRTQKSQKFPHRFIYAGRYLALKGVIDLWNAFIDFQKETNSDWELWLLGEGELFDSRLIHPKVKHMGFIQPTEIPEYLSETGVFIMPSHYDHWGVAVHEFAAAGYPLICSDNVEAASQFLENGKNGFLHRAQDVSSLKKAMIKISRMTDEDLEKMGDISVQKASTITPRDWAAALRSVSEVTV